MSDPSDDLDTQVLSDINSRTLVDGAGIEPGLITNALHVDPALLHDSQMRLQRRGHVRMEPGGLVGFSSDLHRALYAIYVLSFPGPLSFGKTTYPPWYAATPA